jgi:hypothetical protein
MYNMYYTHTPTVNKRAEKQKTWSFLPSASR